MNILIWCCPWGSQGQPLFFQGSLMGMLAPQANALASQGASVTFAVPDYLLNSLSQVNEKINLVEIDSNQVDMVVGGSDPLSELHEHPERFERQLAHVLNEVLPNRIDVIITWENPVPYLRYLYPEALIFSQMPGSFSRAPFPHTITIDPRGLYNHSVLASELDAISKTIFKNEELEFERQFSMQVRNRIDLLQPFDAKSLGVDGYETSLLPLQVSAHYAFQGQSGFRSQADFLTNLMTSRGRDERVIVTQYKSSFTTEAPVNVANFDVLKKRWPHLVWSPAFDAVPSPSHFLTALSDKVVTHSSSVLFQAMAWKKNIEVLPSSYYSKLSANTVEDIDRNTKFLTFILNRYNISSKYIFDGRFMMSLFEEAHSLKKGASSFSDVLPSFSSIDKKYCENVLEAFDHRKILVDLAKANSSVSSRVKVVSEFEKIVNIPTVKVISFDVFDTLIARPFERPADLFKLLRYQGEAVLKRRLRDFADVRMWSEKNARSKSKADEVTLDDIYEGIQNHYDLDDADLKKIKEIEVEIEYKCIRPRIIGQDMFRLAVQSGKRVIFISDMYLPRFAVVQLLALCGIRDGYELFLSSEEGKTKAATTLFTEALKRIGARAEEVVHVGDNPKNDVARAKKVGIRPFHLQNSLTRFQSNKLYTELFPPKPTNEFAKSLVSGMITNKLFDGYPTESEDVSLFHGEPWRLGYAGLGPILSGFAQWLHRNAVRDGRTKLYFLSREGFVLRQIYNAILGEKAIANEYLYCSRRAARVADLKSANDVADLAFEAYAKGSTFHSLLKSRFGLDDDCVKALTSDFYDRELDTSIEGRVYFSQLARSLTDVILEKTSSERAAYLAYLKSIGFLDERNSAVIDLGWKGNMQAALMRLRGAPVKGYYLATLAGAEASGVDPSLIDGFLGDRIGAMSLDPIIRQRKITELLVCHTEPSLERFKFSSGRPTAVFLKEDKRHHRARFIGEVHRGALLFAADYHDYFGGLDDRSLEDHRLTARILGAFLTNPTPIDAALLKGLIFEDSFAGSRAHEVDSFWGANVVNVAEAPQIALQTKLLKTDIIIREPVRSLEKVVIRTFWTKTQFNKYVRNSDRFFSDSNVLWARKWGGVRKRFVRNSR